MKFYNNPEFYSLMGNQIKKYRLEKGLSQELLAEKLNLTRTSITNIEKGRQKILVHTLCAISSILAVDILDLLPNENKTYLQDLEELPNIYRRAVKNVLDMSINSSNEDTMTIENNYDIGNFSAKNKQAIQAILKDERK